MHELRVKSKKKSVGVRERKKFPCEYFGIFFLKYVKYKAAKLLIKCGGK